MEAYTTMALKVNGNTNTNEVANVFTEELFNKSSNEDLVRRFCEDMEIRESDINVDDSCSLIFEDVDYFKDALVKIANEKNCEFTFEAKYEQYTDGLEEYFWATYEGGVLTYKELYAEETWSFCSECDEFIVHARDYDSKETYTCPNCGRVLTAEELFPDGVPTWKVERIRIK